MGAVETVKNIKNAATDLGAVYISSRGIAARNAAELNTNISNIFNKAGGHSDVLDTIRSGMKGLSIAGSAATVVPVVGNVTAVAMQGVAAIGTGVVNVLDDRVTRADAFNEFGRDALGTAASAVPVPGFGAVAKAALIAAKVADKTLVVTDAAGITGTSSSPAKTPSDPSKPASSRTAGHH